MQPNVSRASAPKLTTAYVLSWANASLEPAQQIEQRNKERRQRIQAIKDKELLLAEEATLL